uniref:Uncharacterized protein n=1 Tax=viral metagenome TaxID=1070528 RepID=A0A6C0I6U5_9ZZZZ
MSAAKNPNITTIFNDHFNEFINDICNVFPDNVRILAAKNALSTIRRANPKMIIKIWINYIATPYKSQIEKGDISFFLNKDYTTDLGDYAQSDNIMEYINMLRDPIRNMGQDNQAKAMKYIQNLSKIAELF